MAEKLDPKELASFKELGSSPTKLEKNLYYKTGQLVDISKGGGAFIYIANGEKINGWFNIDLFSDPKDENRYDHQ